MRNVYTPSRVEELNFIVMYSSYSAQNTRFPAIKYKNETLVNHHTNLIKNRFSREKNINIWCVYGNNERQISSIMPPDTYSIFNERYKDTGDARSICLALYNIKTENCFIVDGRFGWTENLFDNITIEDLKRSFVLLGSKCDNIIGSTVNNGRPEILMHGSQNRYSGVCFVNGKSMNTLRNITSDPDNSKLLSFELINKMIEKDKDFRAVIDNSIGTELCL